MARGHAFVTGARRQFLAQVAGVLLQQATGTSVPVLPYRGGGPAIQDLVSGHIDLAVQQAVAALPQVQAGTIKAFANLSPNRSSVVPGIPTSDEGGLAGLYVTGWFGLFAPKGTPKDVIVRLNDAMMKALADPIVRGRFAELGMDVAPIVQQTPEGLATFHTAEVEKWWPIMKAAGIKAPD